MSQKPRKPHKFKSSDARKEENRQIEAIVRKLGLDKWERRELHEAITKRGLTFQQIQQEAQVMFGDEEDNDGGR